ncbi:MAG: hypothetical protein WCI04_02050 [archaeon]
MDLKITEKKKNEVLSRQEIIAEMHEKIIPAKTLIREKLAALLNVKDEQIAIWQVKSKFGSSRAKVYARVYNSSEDLKKSEVKYIRERNFGKEKKAEIASGPEAPPANFKK